MVGTSNLLIVARTRYRFSRLSGFALGRAGAVCQFPKISDISNSPGKPHFRFAFAVDINLYKYLCNVLLRCKALQYRQTILLLVGDIDYSGTK